VWGQAGHAGVEVDDADRRAGVDVEEDVPELRVAVDGALRDLAGGVELLEEPGSLLAGEESVDLGSARVRTIEAVLVPSAMKLVESPGRVVEARDRLVESRAREIRQSDEEPAIRPRDLQDRPRVGRLVDAARVLDEPERAPGPPLPNRESRARRRGPPGAGAAIAGDP
jgi:hypothetical protein